jgi:hypothetical protein
MVTARRRSSSKFQHNLLLLEIQLRVVSVALPGVVEQVRHLVGEAHTSLRERSVTPESESRPLTAIRRLPQIRKGDDRYGQRRCKTRQDR